MIFQPKAARERLPQKPALTKTPLLVCFAQPRMPPAAAAGARAALGGCPLHVLGRMP
jgi:hypothetical protein